MSQLRPAICHAALGDQFYDQVTAATFPNYNLRYRNQKWAKRVGLGGLTDAQWLAHFGKFKPIPGSFNYPLALRYHGHQFQVYNPELGDGRGFLFAQLYDLEDGRLLDLGTKGSGKTPWSRGADGRLTLKGGVREVLATEMLEALGVYTSKSFSLIETGEQLQRGDEPSPTRSSVLVRLSHSHIRIGTFQRFAFLDDKQGIKQLLEHTIKNYLPECWREEESVRAVVFLEEVCRRVARLGAQWTAAGFVHGVLNTDNINVLGESFDYGPWRFLPIYDPSFTAAYFDIAGLYAFGRQPEALAWSLARLAECLLPFVAAAQLESALNTFWQAFQTELIAALLQRLGLKSAGEEQDAAFVSTLFSYLRHSAIPYEQFFFDWRGGILSSTRAANSPLASYYAMTEFKPLAKWLHNFAPLNNINLDHLYFARQKPRTMLIAEVEAIWQAIAEQDDWSKFNQVLAEIREMGNAYLG